jgi:hypothetical protein
VSTISRPTQTMWLVVAAGLLGASLAGRSAETDQKVPTPHSRVRAQAVDAGTAAKLNALHNPRRWKCARITS